MSYRQIVRDCPAHEGCAAIFCEDVDGNVAWISHEDESVDVAGRVNNDLPWTDAR